MIIWYLFLLLSIWCLGFILARLLLNKPHFLEWIGISFILGSFVIGLIWYILNWYADVPINRELGNWTIAICFALLAIFRKETLYHFIRLMQDRISKIRFRSISFIGISIIILYSMTTFLPNAIIPVTDWDALTLYDFRALIVNKTGFFSSPAIVSNYFLGYPPFTSIGHLFGYIFDFYGVKMFYSALILSLSLTFYGLCRKYSSSLSSILATALVITHPLVVSQTYFAYTNLPYMIYYGLASIYLIQWTQSRSHKDMLVAGILFAGSSWIRAAEPLYILAILNALVFLFLFKRFKNWHHLLLLLTPFFFREWWFYHINNTREAFNIHSPVSSELLSSQTDMLDHGIRVINFVFKYAISDFIWLLILAAFAAFFALKQKNLLAIASSVFVSSIVAVLFYGTYVFSKSFEAWENIPDSLTRLSMILLIPACFLVSSLIFKSTDKKHLRRE